MRTATQEALVAAFVAALKPTLDALERRLRDVERRLNAVEQGR